MTLELPDLPYAKDALAPYMSAETLEFHHDKHHKAYVVNGNKLLRGLIWKGSPSNRLSRPPLTIQSGRAFLTMSPSIGIMLSSGR